MLAKISEQDRTDLNQLEAEAQQVVLGIQQLAALRQQLQKRREMMIRIFRAEYGCAPEQVNRETGAITLIPDPPLAVPATRPTIVADPPDEG